MRHIRLQPGLRLSAGFLALLLAACGGGGGSSSSDSDGGFNTAKSCQEQFNPEVVELRPAECQPQFNTQCEDLGFRFPTNVDDPEDCEGVTEQTFTVEAGGQPVDYLVLTPSTGGKSGLYVGLHWRSGNGPTMANQMRLPELAKARNLTVVLPTSPLGTSTRDWDYAGNDVALSAVIADARSRAGLGDAVPVVMAGASSGSAAAIRFFCQEAGQLDGMLLVASGQLSGSPAMACIPAAAAAAAKAGLAPVPVALVQGDQDPAYADVVASVGIFDQVNGCSGSGKTVALNENVDIRYSKTCGSGDGVALVTVKGGGHNWPGFDPPLGGIPLTFPNPTSHSAFNFFGPISNDFDATLQGYDLTRYLD